MTSPLNNPSTFPNTLVLTTVLLIIIGATSAGTMSHGLTPARAVTPPGPIQTPTPRSAAASQEPLDGVADLLVLQSGAKVTLYAADNKSGIIYSHQLDEGNARISFSEFKQFHVSPELEEPTALAYLNGKLLVCDKDRHVLLEVDLSTRAEKVLLRKGDVGGFAAPTSVAASPKGAIAVGSAREDKVWVRAPGALPGAFIATPLPRGVSPTRLFFIQSDLFVVTQGRDIYRLAAGEIGPGEQGVMQRLITGFAAVDDIVYHGGLLFAVDKKGVWLQPYSALRPQNTSVERTPHVSRLTPDREYELSRIAVTPDSVFAVDKDDRSVRIFARPPSVARLRLKGEHLYWLEPITNAVFRMNRTAGTVSASDQIWAGAQLQEATGLAVDEAGVIYIVDRGSPAIYSLKPGGSLSILYKGNLLEQPTDIAAAEGILYVLDSGTRKLLSFNLTRKEIVEEHAYERGSMPDRLSYHRDNLLAFSTSDNVLDRFVTRGEQHTGGGAPFVDWQIAASGEHGTVRRAQRFQLKKALREVADFDHVEGLAYFLEAAGGRIVLLPLEGGEPTSVAYDALARTPTAIAADEKEMFLVDGHRRSFNRTPAIVPVFVDYEGKWTPTKLVSLYSYLLDQKLLTTRPVVYAEPITLETLALETVPTGDYIVEFRKLFCRLNPTLCSTWDAKPAQGAEVIPANREVIVPALRIQQYGTQRHISLPLDTEKSYRTAIFKKYINGPLGPLALEFLPAGFDETTLPERLSKLNPKYNGADIMAATAGDFFIPITAARVYAAVPRAEVINPQSRFNEIANEDNVTAFSPVLMPRPNAAQVRDNTSRETTVALPGPRIGSKPSDLRCKALLPGVVSNAMEIVNYCFPGKLLDANEGVPPPEVGVIDNFFNYKHPIFGGKLEIYKDENATVEVEVPEDDRPQDSTTFVEIDHGTHMAALVGALEQENVMTGFYPRAQIHAIPVTTQLSLAMDRFRTLGLFNLSLGEKSGNHIAPAQPAVETAPLIKLIKTFPAPLFVVSAGNDNKLIRDNTLASFGYLDNVLVVGATNSPSPVSQDQERLPATIWVRSNEEGSSFHEELVGVVAPGEGIKSALWNNGYGTADGTSPATAMVTGAAAVLMNQESWTAWQIKFRLIASADLWVDKELKQNLFPKVFSGMLNMRRAVLDTRVAVADHETNGVCKGRIPSEERDKELKIRQDGGKKPLRIPYGHILRFAQSGDHKFTIIYYEKRRLDEGEGKKGRFNYWLRRVVDVESFSLMEGSTLFRFDVTSETATCRSGTWNLITLKDFLNTFYPEVPDETPDTK